MFELPDVLLLTDHHICESVNTFISDAIEYVLLMQGPLKLGHLFASHSLNSMCLVFRALQRISRLLGLQLTH